VKNGYAAGWLAAAVLGAMVAGAAEAPKFKTTLNAGGTTTAGNSETRQGNAALVSEGERQGLGTVRAGIEANYGDSVIASNRETTIRNGRVFAGAKKTLTPRTFASADASALYDAVAKVDYRAIAGLGCGAYLVKNAKTSLSAEIGPSYVWEKVAGVPDDYLAFRLAESLAQALSGTAKLWESAEYLAKASDFTDYLVTAEVGVEAAVNARMSLRLVLQDKYDSTPAPGLKDNDLTLIAGVAVTL
jgi:putative salt-induced outer membrane protein YdiY